MRISLGTAQLGLDYGVSNETGRPAPEQARELIDLALESGIDSLDTAPAYGDGERLLGELLPAGSRVRLITKTLGDDPDQIVRRFERSLADLGVASVHGLLVHDPAQLAGPGGAELGRRLRGLLEQGLVTRLGVSVYDAAGLEAAERVLPLQIVQLPLNLLDQRFHRDGTIARLHGAGIEVHARSLFLQGLLLIEPDALPQRLAHAGPALAAVRDVCGRAAITPLQAVLGYAAGVDGLRSSLVGVNSAAELRECLAAAEAGPASVDFASLACEDPELTDPRRWPQP